MSDSLLHGYPLRGYRAILAARFRTLLQYRAAAAAGFATQLFWGFIRVMIFEGFYRSSSAPQPLTLPEVITYIWLGQAMLLVLPWNIDSDLRTMIRSGGVVYELLRPLDLYSLWYTRALAMRTAPMLLRAVPMLLLAGAFLGLQRPPSFAAGAGWVATTIGAILLSSAITQVMNVSLLWTVSGDGVSRLMPTLAYLFSGMILPLPLFPEWSRGLVEFLPFRGLADAPFRVFMGSIPAAQIPGLLLHQAVWTLAFVLFGRWLLGRATRRLVVQGG
ncbi:MAG: putative transporter permease protein [Armatimonadetes bacterium]|nr:putative transporter permease protein [Armatimonadota bacterium]